MYILVYLKKTHNITKDQFFNYLIVGVARGCVSTRQVPSTRPPDTARHDIVSYFTNST